MNSNLDGSDEFFDSRDVDERIAEIEGEYADNVGDDEEFNAEAHIGDEDEREEYLKLTSLRDEVSSTEWPYGMTFTSEENFPSYVEEMVKDCGYLPAEVPSWISIDWDETADAVKADYSEVEFEGTTYLYRS